MQVSLNTPPGKWVSAVVPQVRLLMSGPVVPLKTIQGNAEFAFADSLTVSARMAALIRGS